MPPPLVVMILLPLKEKTAVWPKRAGRTEPVHGAERLGGVLHERDLVTPARGDDALVVGALPVEVDGDDRGRATPFPISPVELLVEEVGIEVPRLLLAVEEDRSRADVLHRVRRRDEREGRHDHVVAGFDTGHDHREVQRRGPARQGDGVLAERDDGHLGLERVEVGTGGCEPVRVERTEHVLALERARVGRRQVDPFSRGARRVRQQPRPFASVRSIRVGARGPSSAVGPRAADESGHERVERRRGRAVRGERAADGVGDVVGRVGAQELVDRALRGAGSRASRGGCRRFGAAGAPPAGPATSA